jgi:glycosyltransferase involved in cell wall biosynthesis
MRHVVLYIHTLILGGAERVALNLAETLPDAGLRVTLVVNQASGKLVDQLPPGLRLVSLETPRMRAAVPALRRLLRQERPDALITLMVNTNLPAIWANLLAGRPSRIVASIHSPLSRKVAAGSRRDRLLPLLYALTLPFADRIIACSRGVADDLTACLHRKLDVEVIYNPVVSPRMIELSRAPLEHPWFAAGGIPLILGVGRLVAEKNFPLLIEAVALLRQRRPVRLAILGDGPLREQLAARIDALGLADAAVLLPGDTNPWRYMARAAVLALSSDFEGLPTVLIEAMATGTPVVSTDCPHGPAEILDDGRWGELVRATTPQGFADALARALDSPVDAQALRSRAMAFSTASIAAAYRRMLEELWDGAPGH